MAIDAPLKRSPDPALMTAPFLIVGVVGNSGQPFRPSDWAERLAGVMACYRPPSRGVASPLQYSPFVMPCVHGAVKALRIDPAIAALEPRALDFLLNFARDNDLTVLWDSEDA